MNQMLANLVIAKKAAAVEAKALKEKKANNNDNNKPGHDGGLPVAKRTGNAALAADERTEPGGEGRGAARGTGGQDEPGTYR